MKEYKPGLQYFINRMTTRDPLSRRTCLRLLKKYKINVSVSKFIKGHKKIQKDILRGVGDGPRSTINFGNYHDMFQDRISDLIIELKRDWEINKIIS